MLSQCHVLYRHSYLGYDGLIAHSDGLPTPQTVQTLPTTKSLTNTLTEQLLGRNRTIELHSLLQATTSLTLAFVRKEKLPITSRATEDIPLWAPQLGLNPVQITGTFTVAEEFSRDSSS